MAADNVGVTGTTDTLVAATARKIQLTGPGSQIRIVHHGGAATQPIFFTTASSEAGLVAASATADDMKAVAAGTTRIVNCPRDITGIWVSLLSAGTPGVTVELV